MEQRQVEPGPLGLLLIKRMSELGMTRFRDLAAAASVSNSTISRAIYGRIRPGVDVLASLAQALELDRDELIKFAYGDTAGVNAVGPSLHPKVAELQRMLGPGSPLPKDDRRLLEILVDRIMDPHRPDMRRATLPAHEKEAGFGLPTG